MKFLDLLPPLALAKFGIVDRTNPALSLQFMVRFDQPTLVVLPQVAPRYNGMLQMVLGLTASELTHLAAHRLTLRLDAAGRLDVLSGETVVEDEIASDVLHRNVESGALLRRHLSLLECDVRLAEEVDGAGYREEVDRQLVACLMAMEIDDQDLGLVDHDDIGVSITCPGCKESIMRGNRPFGIDLKTPQSCGTPFLPTWALITQAAIGRIVQEDISLVREAIAAAKLPGSHRSRSTDTH